MASLIAGYEYDIFISYRRKDNKYDGWVSAFAENLKAELESTFKEDVSVYFDENPHDTLLETYDVDASLKDKLKCLVFIPVLSRTYCDPKSFAWKHEFEAFVSAASADRFGLKVRLPNGYVASRILPVKIYDLDPSDSVLFENVIGGVIRSVDFIYQSSGVNRPLLPKEEKPYENMNHTNYRDQINKVGNTLREIISAMQHSVDQNAIIIGNKVKVHDAGKNKKINLRLAAGIIAAVLITILAVMLFRRISVKRDTLEKSIAVLPLKYYTPADTNIYYLNALMGNVLTHLQEIKDLSPRSRTSCEKFRNTDKTIPEIAKELRVNYIVESTCQKTGRKMQLVIALYRVDKMKETRLWGHTYNEEIAVATDIFRIESRLAEDIATELNAIITPLERKQIEKAPTANLAAYEDYLMGQNYMRRFNNRNFDEAMKYFVSAKDRDPAYALAYVGICEAWINRGLSSGSTVSEVTPNALTAFENAYKLDSTLSEVYVCSSWIQSYLLYDVNRAEKDCKKALSINPGNPDVMISYANVLIMLGRFDEALEHARNAIRLDPLNLNCKGPYAVILMCSGRYSDAIKAFREVLNVDPQNGPALDNLALALHMAGSKEEALKQWESVFRDYFNVRVNVLIDHNENLSYEALLNSQGNSLVADLDSHYINPTEIAQVYACAGNREKAIDLLERALADHDPNLPYSLRFPVFGFIKDDPRYKSILNKLNLQ